MYHIGISLIILFHIKSPTVVRQLLPNVDLPSMRRLLYHFTFQVLQCHKSEALCPATIFVSVSIHLKQILKSPAGAKWLQGGYSFNIVFEVC